MRMPSLRLASVGAVVEYNGGPPEVDGTDCGRTNEFGGTGSIGSGTAEFDGTDSASVVSGGVAASRGGSVWLWGAGASLSPGFSGMRSTSLIHSSGQP
jgi:hypothetical protein